MDTRYHDQGYVAKLLEEQYGAYLTITKNNTVVAEVAVGFFSGGRDAKAQIVIKRFRPNEFRDVTTEDDFDG